MTAAVSGCYAGDMALSRERILEALAQLPFIDNGDLALVLGEPSLKVRRVSTARQESGTARPTKPAQIPYLGGHHVQGISPGQRMVVEYDVNRSRE